MSAASRRSVWKAVSLTVFIAGTLDISDALVFYGIRYRIAPVLLLQNIASHLLGRSAFAGGVAAALLGLALHYCIATFWIALFILAAQRFSPLFRAPVLFGSLYGLIIYFAMNKLVLPHSIVLSPPGHDPVALTNAVLALVFFMGITVALLNRRFAPAADGAGLDR